MKELTELTVQWQYLFFDIIFIWGPIGVYIAINIMFFGDWLGFFSAPREMFKGAVPVITIGVTVMLIVVFYRLYKLVKFKFKEARIIEANNTRKRGRSFSWRE